jgi:hypothetical protein
MLRHTWQALKKLATVIGLLVLWEVSAWAQGANNWFAVVGSFREQALAEQLAQRLSTQGHRPEIYLAENAYYAVVLGGYLDLKQAKQLSELARKQGFDDAYIWRSERWGKNLFRPAADLPQAVALLPPLADIQQQVTSLLNDPHILRPWVSKTISLSIFQPTIILSPGGQQLALHFSFLYTVAGDPRYQGLKTQEGKGAVEVTAEIKSTAQRLVLGQVSLKSFAQADLPPEVEGTLRSEWLEALRKRLEGTPLPPKR